MSTHREKLRLLAIACLILGLGLLLTDLDQRTSFSPENIKTVRGTLKSYQFENRGRSGLAYSLMLHGNPRSFQIPAVLIEDFDEQRFIARNSTQDTLALAYLEVQSVLFKDRDVLLEIDQNGFKFLRTEESIKKIQQEKALMRMIAPLFILIGLTILYLQRKRKPALKSPQPPQ